MGPIALGTPYSEVVGALGAPDGELDRGSAVIAKFGSLQVWRQQAVVTRLEVTLFESPPAVSGIGPLRPPLSQNTPLYSFLDYIESIGIVGWTIVAERTFDRQLCLTIA